MLKEVKIKIKTMIKKCEDIENCIKLEKEKLQNILTEINGLEDKIVDVINRVEKLDKNELRSSQLQELYQKEKMEEKDEIDQAINRDLELAIDVVQKEEFIPVEEEFDNDFADFTPKENFKKVSVIAYQTKAIY